MRVKIDTKEKFHIIALEEPVLSANLTEDLKKYLLLFLTKVPKNVVINFENVKEIDEAAATTLITVQQTFYDTDCSLVICNLLPEIETYLDEKELLELMNVTPTVSEAGDIVQMEEIEREFN